jgi:hypothetical protein
MYNAGSSITIHEHDNTKIAVTSILSFHPNSLFELPIRILLRLPLPSRRHPFFARNILLQVLARQIGPALHPTFNQALLAGRAQERLGIDVWRPLMDGY